MKKLLLLGIVIGFLSSCGSHKKTIIEKPKKETTNKETTKPVKEIKPKPEDENLDFNVLRYIAKFSNVAKKEMKDYGIPASITMAQGILESQSGKSRLAVEANNHFGIKCHGDWKGEKILHDDNTAQECFRKYNNPEESYKDHSKFLANRKRYAFLFRLPKTDFEAWARGLKKAGYATDPSYPDKLIYIINKYHLDKMDKEVLKEMSVKVTENEENHKSDKKKFIYEVKAGETLFTIAHKFNIPVKDIQRINNLNDFDIYEGQILVLTESEEENSTPEETQTTIDKVVKEEPIVNNTPTETPKDITGTSLTKPEKKDLPLHIVKQGETIFSISKKYGVDVNDLRKINNLSGNEIKVGSVIKIPYKKDQEDKPTEEPKKKPEDKAVYHIVQPGETLYRIHINYKVPISKLRKLNHLKGNYIKVGQKLRVK